MVLWSKSGYFNENLLLKTERDDRFYTMGEWLRACGQVTPFASDVHSPSIVLQVPFLVPVLSMEALMNERFNQAPQGPRQHPYMMSNVVQSPAPTPTPMQPNGRSRSIVDLVPSHRLTDLFTHASGLPPMAVSQCTPYVIMNGGVPPPPPVFSTPPPFPGAVYRSDARSVAGPIPVGIPNGVPPPVFYSPTSMSSPLPPNGVVPYGAPVYQRPMLPPYFPQNGVHPPAHMVPSHLNGVLSENTENPSTISNTPESENASQCSEGILVADKGVDTTGAPWLRKTDASTDPIQFPHNANVVSIGTQTSALEVIVPHGSAVLVKSF